MDTNRKPIEYVSKSDSMLHAPFSMLSGPRGFTLVELLVVITIIGILASLITVAAVGALKKGRETEIKAEINQMDSAFMEYKNKTTAFPPNCQTDDTSTTGNEQPTTPIEEATIFNDLKRHLAQAFPRHREPDNLIRALAGLPCINSAGDPVTNYPRSLEGGMSAAEAIVFWLSGFSSDTKYPISGEGGPSYEIPSFNATPNVTLDPVENRKWIFPLAVGRLGPRDDKFFDASNNRFIEYIAPNGSRRRINFWQYYPRRSEQPYLYFDVSRNTPTPAYDPPAATELTGNALHVHAFKQVGDVANTVQFVNQGKFQIIHSGDDGEWGEEFELMSAHDVQADGGDPTNPNDYDLLYPDGPFTGEIGDSIVNFTTETKIEDAQK